MKRTAQLYLVILGIAAVILLVLHQGAQLPLPVATGESSGLAAHVNHVGQVGGGTFLSSIKSTLTENGSAPLSKLIMQLIVIIVACSILGSLFTRWKQPAVVGEMVAGVLLGPSLFG